MKDLNCQTLRREIEEADLDWQPVGKSLSHLRSCPGCQVFNDEQRKLRMLVGDLGTIQAPADFDFRLRARLANERPNSAVSFFSFALSGWRPAALTVVVLLVVGGFLFRTFNQESVTPNLTAEVTPTESPVVSTPAAPSSVAADSTDETAAVAANEVSQPQTRKQDRRAVPSERRTTATREFSSEPAAVVRRNDVIDEHPAFPIEAAPRDVILSVDDGSGIARTVSLPRISFGSQRVLGEEAAVVKTSQRGAW